MLACPLYSLSTGKLVRLCKCSVPARWENEIDQQWMHCKDYDRQTVGYSVADLALHVSWDITNLQCLQALSKVFSFTAIVGLFSQVNKQLFWQFGNLFGIWNHIVV